MRDEKLHRRLNAYQATAIFSVLFALMGFSYNVWRMEVTEHNSNVREASFEMLLQLAELEQLVYAAYYDQDAERGNPRQGWVKVGLIIDLSVSSEVAVQEHALKLREVWTAHWEPLPSERASANAIVAAIDGVRDGVRMALQDLD